MDLLVHDELLVGTGRNLETMLGTTGRDAARAETLFDEIDPAGLIDAHYCRASGPEFVTDDEQAVGCSLDRSARCRAAECFEQESKQIVAFRCDFDRCDERIDFGPRESRPVIAEHVNTGTEFCRGISIADELRLAIGNDHKIERSIVRARCGGGRRIIRGLCRAD